jgi:hypothetical protein
MFNNNKSLLYFLLSLLTFISGYTYLRYAYKVTDETPFTQEIILILLGTLVTMFITALLLQKQTSVEIEKEQSIRYIGLKTTIYQQLLELLENMSIVDEFTKKEIIKLQFLTHRLAIIASPEVIEAYQIFLSKLQKISSDRSFEGEMDTLHNSLCLLTLQIRKDILGKNHNTNYTESDINNIIFDNSNKYLLN